MRKFIDLDQASQLVVVSGIPVGDSGTGRFVAHLQARITKLVGKRVKIISRPERPASWHLELLWRNKAYWRALKEVLSYAFLLAQFWLGMFIVWLSYNKSLIVLHPQNLGYRLALRLIESRKQPPLIYLLDSSFFCIASYNHLKGVNGSCLRCLEHGFEQAVKNGCEPFPLPDLDALEFAPRLQTLVKEGRVNVAAQNLRQAELAQRHFGLLELPRVIGLWTQDWDDVFADITQLTSYSAPTTYSWDVIFHGHCLDAKGVSWTASVATHCPDLRFMFPFSRPDGFLAPLNCSFVPCTWESGLRNEINKSRFVIVPSLWSAPIEGALVKSIVCAAAVVVVNNPTSYCDELPDGLILKLSAHPETGAVELQRAFDRGWHPDAGIKVNWLNEFVKMKADFVLDLLEVALSGRKN